jgi:hypothetical protein
MIPPDEQMSFYDLEPQSAAWSDADTDSVRQHLDDTSQAVAVEHMAVARFTLDEAVKRQARGSLNPGQNLPLHVAWARWRRNPKRPQAPRANIPASVRHAVMADAYRRCGQCGRDGNESSLQLGHILSMVDAWDLMYVLGDNTPLRIASWPGGAVEDLFAQCERCNIGAGACSQTAQSAGVILMRPRGDTLRLRWHFAAQVVDYCRLVEQLNAGEEPK